MSRGIKKQSILIAALTSTFGIFVSKALGLLYYSPLSAFAGESNMFFYSVTYSYYDLLLKISGAGIPFAIASLVARYYAKQDYKTVLLVRKLGTSIIMGISVIASLLFVIFSRPLAIQTVGSSNPSDVEHLRNLFLILVIAVILVPFLSSVRGYYQGLKRLDLYGASQALEQFVRVIFILVFGYIVTQVIKMDNIYAIYCAIAAAGIAALFTLIFFFFTTRKDDKHINELINNQTSPAESKKKILNEIIAIGVPYLAISFLGTLSTIINTTFFVNTATSAGFIESESKLALGILQANCAKLGSIPQVLTLGFSSGLVPYLVESFEKQDFEKLSDQITQIIDTVFYILVPALMVFVFFARDIYFVMYGNHNLDLATKLFQMNNLVIFTDTIAPILSSVMITLKLRKEATLTLLISVVIKLVSFVLAVSNHGAYGICISTAISSAFVIVTYLIIIDHKYNIRFFVTGKRLILIIIASGLSIIPVYLATRSIPFDYASRLVHIGKLAVCGAIMLPIYYFVSSGLLLPQKIFKIKKMSPKALLKRFRSH